MKQIVIIFFLYFSLPFFAQSEIKKMEIEADSLYNAKQYNASIQIYNLLLSKNPKNSFYLSNQGLNYFKLNDFKKTKENFRLSILYEDSDNKESLAINYSNLSACFLELNEFTKGYEYALKAYHLDKNDSTILWNVASLANNVQDYKKVIEILNNASIDKHNDFNSLYGTAYLSLGENEKSINYYEIFLKILIPKIDL